MASYKVTSELVAGKSLGDIITDEELQGVSIDALIAAGHIESNKQTKKAEAE